MNETVPEMLREAASLYEEKGKIYGNNYKQFGKIMEILLPMVTYNNGYKDHNRLGIIVHIITKLTRYCQNFNNGGHSDSLDDLAVYTMMLKELDAELKVEPRIIGEKVYAPFSADEMMHLNEYQSTSGMHEFNCVYNHSGSRKLIATQSGWICPTCLYQQNWALKTMADGSAVKAFYETMNELVKV